MKLYSPVKRIAKFPATAQPGLVAAERIFEFLDAPVEIRDSPEAASLKSIEREISFENVSFSYRDGDPAIDRVSFCVPKASMLALVGPSGSG